MRAPDRDDWEKLRHLVEYLRKDHARALVLGAKNNGLLMWYVDASFSVHPNMRGHTGGGLTMGREFPISMSTKQKLNTRSSTESELVGIDDMMPIILWTRYFLLSPGYGVVVNLFVGRRGTNQLRLLERYRDVLDKHTTEIPPLTALVEETAPSALVEDVSLG